MAYTAFFDRIYGTLYDYFMNGFSDDPEKQEYWRKQVQLGFASEVFSVPYHRNLTEANKLFVLMMDCKEVIAKTAARKTGDNTLFKIMSKTIKDNLKAKERHIGGAYRDEDGLLYVANRYYVMQTDKNFDLPSVPEGAVFPTSVIDMLRKCKINALRRIEVPTAAEAKTFIKLKKQENKKARLFQYCINDGEGHDIYFNAELLANVLTFLGTQSDIVAYVTSSSNVEVAPIFLTNNNGESAILCPMRKV